MPEAIANVLVLECSIRAGSIIVAFREKSWSVEFETPFPGNWLLIFPIQDTGMTLLINEHVKKCTK